MRDHEPPSVESLLEASSYVEDGVSGGRVVLVHCLAGKGRTGCVLAAYLIAYEGKTARQAIDELRAARPGSVESQQEQRVLEFEAEAVKARSSGALAPTSSDMRRAIWYDFPSNLYSISSS
jgi:atypical dual specificity phosphatase